MWKNRLIGIVFAGIPVFVLFGCGSSSEGSQFMPQQVLTNALEEPEENAKYYGEATITLYEKEEITETIQLKEWVNEIGERRVETIQGDDKSIAVNDGEKLVTYQPKENTAFVIEDPELLTMNQMSPKEQADSLLKIIRDSHKLSEGEEKEIAGRETYHLIAKANDEGDLLGDMEVWIDKENWMVLKMISTSGDIKSDYEYTKIDFNPKFKSDTFSLSLPPDVTIENMEDMQETAEVSLEEAVQSIGKSFLVLPETDGIAITKVEQLDIKGGLNRIEVNIDYEKDGLPYMFLTVFESNDELEVLPGEEGVLVRNQKASYMDINDFRSLVWQEDGLNYSVVFLDPDLNLETFQNLANDMVGAEEISE